MAWYSSVDLKAIITELCCRGSNWQPFGVDSGNGVAWSDAKPFPWWRHQMETLSALLAICAGNSPVPGEFPAQRPVTRSFDVFFDLRLNKRLSKQPWGWWFETLSRSLWRHRGALNQRWPDITNTNVSAGFIMSYTKIKRITSHIKSTALICSCIFTQISKYIHEHKQCACI